MIELVQVSKRFGDNIVFDHVSEQFTAGKIHGIIGRNGSGKTVLLRLIIGLYYPDSGSVIVHGKHIGRDVEFAPRTGFVMETPLFLSQFSGIENLMLLARLNHIIDIKQVRKSMEIVGLNPDEKKKVGRYSLGMRQRLGIAQAIMENPDILILDEPMNSLDKAGICMLRELLSSIKSAGKTVFLATHSQTDIDMLCDDLYEVSSGKLISRSLKEK